MLNIAVKQNIALICSLIGVYLLSPVYSLAIKNAEDNGPTRRDPASSELLCDGDQ